MRIEITLQPLFWLSLFRRDVDTLMKLAEHHYDSVCRESRKPGHFLYGWYNTTRDQSPCDDHQIENVPKCSGTRRDLDTALKICEGTRMAQRARLITCEDAQRMDQLCALILTAFETSVRTIDTIQIDPVTAPTDKGRLMWATAPGRF